MGTGWTWAGWAALGLLVGYFFPGVAMAGENRSILAVMEIEDTSGTLSAKDVQTATDYLRGRLTATGSFFVIDKSRQAAALQKVVSESKKDSYQECRDKECQIPLGQALSADSILRTVILHMGGVYTVQAELVDLSREAAVKGATVDFEETPGVPPARSLIKALRTLVSKLVGEAPRQTQRTSKKAPPNWAYTAGIFGVVASTAGLALGSASAMYNDPESDSLYPSIPLGVAALIDFVVSVPLVQNGAKSARDEFGVVGSPVARTFGWGAYWVSVLSGTLLVLTGLESEVPNGLIYATTFLGAGSIALMSLDAFKSHKQAEALRASQARNIPSPNLGFALIPVPDQNGSTHLVFSLAGRY